MHRMPKTARVVIWHQDSTHQNTKILRERQGSNHEGVGFGKPGIATRSFQGWQLGVETGLAEKHLQMQGDPAPHFLTTGLVVYPRQDASKQVEKNSNQLDLWQLGDSAEKKRKRRVLGRKETRPVRRRRTKRLLVLLALMVCL